MIKSAAWPLIWSAALCLAPASCAPRSVRGWGEMASTVAVANGEGFIAAGGADLGADGTSVARATLGELYRAKLRLDYLAANRAGVRRAEADWAELEREIAAAYSILDKASRLPAAELAIGPDHPPVTAALASAENVLLRFGGGPPPNEPLRKITP